MPSGNGTSSSSGSSSTCFPLKLFYYSIKLLVSVLVKPKLKFILGSASATAWTLSSVTSLATASAGSSVPGGSAGLTFLSLFLFTGAALIVICVTAVASSLFVVQMMCKNNLQGMGIHSTPSPEINQAIDPVFASASSSQQQCQEIARTETKAEEVNTEFDYILTTVTVQKNPLSSWPSTKSPDSPPPPAYDALFPYCNIKNAPEPVNLNALPLIYL